MNVVGGAFRVDPGCWGCDGSTVGVVGNGVCSGLLVQTVVGDRWLLIMDGEGLTVVVVLVVLLGVFAAAAAAAFMDASIWGSEIVVNSSHGNDGSSDVGGGANSAILLPSVLISHTILPHLLTLTNTQGGKKKKKN